MNNKWNKTYFFLLMYFILSNLAIGQIQNEKKNIVLYIAEFWGNLPNGRPICSKVAYYQKSDFISLVDDTLLTVEKILQKGSIVPALYTTYVRLLTKENFNEREYNKFCKGLAKMNRRYKFVCSIKDTTGNYVDVSAVKIFADILIMPVKDFRYETTNAYIRYGSIQDKYYIIIKKIHKSKRFKM